MLFSSISWVILTLTLLVALPGALASPSPKRSKKSASTRVTIETYPAMEDGELVVPREGNIPALEPAAIAKLEKSAKVKPSKTNKRVQTLGAPAPVAAPISAPAAYVVNDSEAEPASAAPQKFELVPAEKRAQILKRMALCQTLFEKTGRAYDYRAMTTTQLEAELNAVTANDRPIAKQETTEQATVHAAPSEPDPILDAQE